MTTESGLRESAEGCLAWLQRIEAWRDDEDAGLFGPSASFVAMDAEMRNGVYMLLQAFALAAVGLRMVESLAPESEAGDGGEDA